MIGNQVLYSGVFLNWPHPERVTRLRHRWGAPEAEIFVFKFLLWPGFEPRTSQSKGHERNHSNTATPQDVKKAHLLTVHSFALRYRGRITIMSAYCCQNILLHLQ